MKKMTMADIAKVAGVSKTTVSRYFNGGYVKEETRQKIEKIVKEYDYEPNVLAANLKANKTHTVGIVCPTLTSYASSRMMMNIDQFLKKHHYTTIIINTNHDELDEIMESLQVLILVTALRNEYVTDPDWFLDIRQVTCKLKNILVALSRENLMLLIINVFDVKHQHICVFQQLLQFTRMCTSRLCHQ